MSEPRNRNCLGCTHHNFNLATDAIECMHPQRPEEQRQVVRWMNGCAQHQPKENHELL